MSERECNEVFLWREGIVPDYLNDLNAIHEAEKLLREGGHCAIYIDELRRLHPGPAIFPLLHATASQRSEALLRTIGRWKEDV